MIFFVLGDIFESCLENLKKVLQRYVHLNLVLNWGK